MLKVLSIISRYIDQANTFLLHSVKWILSILKILKN